MVKKKVSFDPRNTGNDCSHKHMFADISTANKVLRGMRKKKQEGRIPSIYRCPSCLGYHIGSRLRDNK